MALKRRLLEKGGWTGVWVDKERDWDARPDGAAQVAAMREMLAPFVPIRAHSQ